MRGVHGLMGPRLVRQDITVFVLVVTAAMAFAGNPGLKMRLTEAGIAYANTVAEAAIRTQLQTLKIPDQSGDDHGLSWTLTNIQIQSVSGPNSQITLSPEQNGLSWTLSSLGMSLRADWHAKYKKGWFKISDGGSVDVNVGDASLSLTVGLGQKDGRPSVSTRSCSDNIGGISVDFHGGSAFIYNLFRSIVENKIRDILQTRICDIVNNEVNIEANQVLSKLNVYIEIDHRFLLDYGLIMDPSVTSNYLETSHKGEVYWEADKQECPFSPSVIPPSGDVSRMLYLWLTEYTANTFAYVAHNHGYLKYNVTKDELPADEAGYLNTTCKYSCVGKLIPQIGKLYPDSWVELRIASNAVPEVKITSQNLTAAAYADVEMVAHTPDGSMPHLLTLAVNLSLTANASVVNEKLTATILGHSLDVAVKQSDIGPVNARILKMILDGVLSNVIILQLNKIGSKGIDLPVTGDVRFKNTDLIFLDGVLQISTDLEYLKILRFLPEIGHIRGTFLPAAGHFDIYNIIRRPDKFINSLKNTLSK